MRDRCSARRAARRRRAQSIPLALRSRRGVTQAVPAPLLGRARCHRDVVPRVPKCQYECHSKVADVRRPGELGGDEIAQEKPTSSRAP